jgi:PAS domain S-box-containing protein
MENRKDASTVKSTHILHVDDDLSFLEVSKQIIQDMNSVFNVEFALSVDEALSKLRKNCYNIIVSDYDMPDRSGLDFLKAVKKNGWEIPFILFTGKGREEVAIQALNLGADGYYNKQGAPETVYGELVHGILTVHEKWRIKQALEESEKRYSALMEQATDAIILHDIAGQIIDVNQQVCKKLGYKKGELKGLNISCIDDNATDANRGKFWPKVVAGETLTFESVNRRKDGTTFPVEVSLGPINIGGQTLIMGAVRDITIRKKIERSLEESQKRFQDLIETTGEFIWEMDPQGRYTYCSPQMHELWGIKPESMIGKTPFDVMPPQSRELARQAFLSLGLSPMPFKNLESTAYDGQGRPIKIEINGRPFFDEQGKLLGFRGITRDITERKRNEEQQKISYRKIQKANEKLQVVGSLTRHDVINKLTNINARAYLVKKKFGDNPDIVKAMDTIRLAVEQSNKLFEFSKLYEKIGSEELTAIDIHQTFSEAKSLLGASQVKFTCNCNNLKVQADSMLLQVFYNLIDNSLKHGMHVLEIQLNCTISETEDRIIYSDDGIGVAANSKEKIFAKSFSADGKSGHGLYLVRKIVEEYGWSIKETGVPDVGARFEITIPKGTPSIAQSNLDRRHAD